jgi:hypothetical protein
MQPYEPYSEEEAEETDYLARIARRARMTDEEVRALGYKESVDYPGYFENDPRHPFFTVADRYLMDHPGPDWKTKERASKRTRPCAWDEEQLFGKPTPTGDSPPRSVKKIVPITFKEAEGVLTAESHESSYFDPRLRQSGFWICRICRKALALWPSERALRLKLFGLSITLVFRSPLACTNCRVFEFPTIQALGREDHRKFWQRVIACWEHPQLLIPRGWYRKALGLHRTLRNVLTYRSRL